jgi:methylmalonyl-CoA mutase C-terminal domain/subunit
MERKRRVRIMVAKPGLDGHDRGARIIARAYRDAGYEVVYTGLHQTPEEIVEAAIQEDVDLIGLSSLAGAHRYLFPRVVALLREKRADDIVVIGGGIIPKHDIPMLKVAGIKDVFTPGTPLGEITKWVEDHVKPRGV